MASAEVALSSPDHERFTREGWILFVAMGVIWGVPYLLIKVAVEHLSPAVIVFGRTVIAAVPLLAIAAWRGELRGALAKWPMVLAFAVMEMAIPWVLLTHAEVHLPSGLTGMLLAIVPLIGAVVAYLLGDRHALRPLRIAGLAVGLIGVALLVATDLRGETPVLAIVEIVIVCIGYAVAPFIASRRLNDVGDIGVVALSLSMVAVGYAPAAWITRPTEHVPWKSWMSIVGLGVVCTLIAFVIFFRLIASVGPARATWITFINPAVAVVVGAILLDEKITVFTLLAFVVISFGLFLGTRGNVSSPADPVTIAE